MTASLVEEFHVLIAALLILVLLPAWTLRGLSGSSWKIAYWIPAATSFWVIVAFLLSLMHSLRFTTLIVVAILAIVLLPRLLDRGSTHPATTGLWHLMGHPRTGWRKIWLSIRGSLRATTQLWLERYGLLACLLTLVGVMVTLVRNSLPVLHQAAPGTPLGYVNLLQIADITTNHGFFVNGATPIGLPALGATLSSMFFVQPLDALRFLYPLTALTTVLASGALAHEVTENPKLTALTVFLAGATGVGRLGFPVNWASPLTLHWALIGVLFSLTHLTRYAKDPTGSRPVFLGVSVLVTTLFSPVMALIPVIAGCTVMSYRCWFDKTLQPGLRRVGFPVAVGLVIGFLPLGYASLLMGRSLGPLTTYIPLFQRLVPLYRDPFAPPNLVILVTLVLALFAIVVGRSRTVKLLATWEVGVIALAEILMMWIPQAAWTLFASGIVGLIALPAMVQWALGPLLRDNQYPRGLSVLVAVCAIMGLLAPVEPYVLARYEPPHSARTVLAISRQFEPYQWTIVSPVQQYSEILGLGWHEELSLFVESHALNQAKHSQFQLAHDGKLSIDTPNVFIFVEPHLFPSQKPVSQHLMTRPIASGTAAYQGASLAALESRAYYWVLAYHHTHPKTSSFYVKTRDLMVLWIRQ